jgi:Tfp pilus assembly PilM family ATPase
MTLENMYRAIYQIITPYIEELIDELHKMLAYLRSEERNAVFEGIFMYGRGTFINSLDAYIERRLNIPTKLINPMTNIALHDDSILPDISEGAPFALAMGLAMRRVAWL